MSSTDIVKKLQEEIKTLEYELNFELPKELQRARALGDLSENAEFHMAKQRQDYVGARLGQLKKRLQFQQYTQGPNCLRVKSHPLRPRS